MLDPADGGTHSRVSSHASHMTCWGKLMTSLWNHFPASHPCDMHSPPHPWSRKSSSKSRQAGFALQAEARGETLQKAEVGSRKQQWVDSCSAADKPNVCLTQAKSFGGFPLSLSDYVYHTCTCIKLHGGIKCLSSQSKLKLNFPASTPITPHPVTKWAEKLKNLQLATWKLLVVGFVFDMYCNYSCSEFVQRQNRLSVVTSLFQIQTCLLIL